MRALIQRVKHARVMVAGHVSGAIDAGFLVFLGVHRNDDGNGARKLAEKTANLRIMNDSAGKMNHSLLDSGGGVLVISQFTLYAETHKGNRPSFVEAAPGEPARQYYAQYVEHLQSILGPDRVATGVFAASMQVELLNDGPVTILLEIPPPDSRQPTTENPQPPQRNIHAT